MARKLKKTQVEVVAEKVMDWGNLVFTGLVIGQLVPGSSPVRWFLFLLGILCMFFASENETSWTLKTRPVDKL